ncbi:MAG: GAF domain-containing protein [Candidatus Atribacteria bacterium]|nr:GAF domain-containing protein [Candidatus Atribacteria bacterium]MCD6350375.1 GAF domain-containing protein [Candidatus Atribacteria bacterium]
MKEKLEAITRISELIASNMYFEDILKLIVTITAQVMQSSICSLMLLDEEKGVLEVKATQSVSEAYNSKPPLRLGEGIAGRVALEGKPIIVKDVKKDPRYVNKDIAIKEGLSSLISLPLQVKGKIVGVLNLYTPTLRDFSKEEIRVLTAIANQVAVVVENYRLLVESELIKEELEKRKKIERAKGVLMKEFGIDEDEAYRRIQRYSMDKQKPMKEVAEAIIMAWELKQKH